MCVIMYKPTGTKFPKRKVLEKLFDKNPDGAGYMLPYDNNVIIKKGFMTFKDFEKSLTETFHSLKLDPVTTPVVCHFRISTQGGVKQGLCHPFPVCETYEEMRSLDTIAKFGIAHNGIITLTSESSYSYGHYDHKTQTWVSTPKVVDYNDTMTFIKNYALQIIDNDTYFARNKHKCELLERLIGYSKLAIMNSKGFVKLIGEFYLKDNCYYSNLHWDEKDDWKLPTYLLDKKYL